VGERRAARRLESKLVVDRGHAPESVGVIAHLGGLVAVERGRLLAEHVRAGIERGEHHRMVEIHRGDDADEIGVGLLDEPAPVSGGLRNPELVGDAPRLLRVRSREPHDLESRVPRQTDRMHMAAERGAEDDGAQSLHGSSVRGRMVLARGCLVNLGHHELCYGPRPFRGLSSFHGWSLKCPIHAPNASPI
jgi:hypothetical protein